MSGLGVSDPKGVYLVPGDVPQVLPPVGRQMPVNLLPCSKLRLRAVKMAVTGCPVLTTLGL